MLSLKSDNYLNEILTYVKSSFDRDNIRAELENHITDKMDFYIEQGYDRDAAEQLSIYDMGDAKEIGTELNKQHNPIIGWLWFITNVMIILILILFFYCSIFSVGNFFRSNLINNISKSDIVYRIDVHEKVQIDDTVICFTNVVYKKNSELSIFYESYNTKLQGFWSISYLGEITDNLGNKYMSSSGQSNSGIITKGVHTVNYFSKDADVLIISYDRYNRKYRVEIPLKEGDNSE